MVSGTSAAAATVVAIEVHAGGGTIAKSGGARSDVGDARRRFTERRGLLVRLIDGTGAVGLGEASPLPGRSPDTVAECAAALRSIDVGSLRSIDLRTLPALLETVPQPAARFALETAALDLIGQKSDLSISKLVARMMGSGHTAPRIPVNAMLDDIDRARDDLAAAHARGIRCAKVKIGRPGQFRAELAVLRDLRARYGDSVQLRLDVNRAWTVDEARGNLDELVAVAPEYVEEPSVDLAATARSSPVPLAADESLADPDGPAAVGALLERGHLRAVVLKPAALGGALRCAWWAARARAHGALAVVSHLLGGPVELAACAQLALALGGEQACGLDRHAGLAAWPAVAVPAVAADRVRETATPGLGLDGPEARKLRYG